MDTYTILLLFIPLVSSIASGSEEPHGKPNIIFILADDLGWNDVGFHGSNQIPTPNIDSLAYTGVILDNYYVSPICTPTRASIMTGKYPIHTGLQFSVIHGAEPFGLGLEEKILPQYLKMYGYSTRAVGKWHLGHFKKEYTPEFRGFDSHYGGWLGRQDYYDHSAMDKGDYWGYDLKRGMKTVWSDYGTYTTDLYTNEAVKVIKDHNASEPLFLYLAHQAVHTGNGYNALAAPAEKIAKFSYIKKEKRRKFAGMLSKLDDSVGEVVSALTEKGMINNSIIIFSSDNGGPAAGFGGNAASNWPLRGVKGSLWQGGVRGAGLIWSPLLPSGKISKALMHATDWLPTLLGAIEANASLSDIDGMNLWNSLAEGVESPRSEILLNIDPKHNISGVILHNWKLIMGHDNGEWDKWYGPSGSKQSYDWKALRNCKTTKSLEKITPLPNKDDIENLRRKLRVPCKHSPEEMDNFEPADEEEDLFLFDLEKDPCEMNNIASSNSIQLKIMEDLIAQYKETMVEPRNQPRDPRSHPKYWGYKWINWMDYI